MFLIISPASLSSFFTYTCLFFYDTFIGLPCGASLLCLTFTLVHVSYMCGSLVLYSWYQQWFLLLFIFSVESVGHCGFYLFSHVYICTVLFDPFASLSRVAAATFRFHNYTCRARICSSCCLNWVYRFPFVLVISVKTASHDAVADAKFMKASSILPCFSLLMLSYTADPVVW